MVEPTNPFEPVSKVVGILFIALRNPSSQQYVVSLFKCAVQPLRKTCVYDRAKEIAGSRMIMT